jgi:hypothetical protein
VLTFDWQTIAVALIVAGAFFYAARRALARLRSFRAGPKAGAGCATGCGKCGDEVAPARPANALVQISQERVGRRREAGQYRPR